MSTQQKPAPVTLDHLDVQAEYYGVKVTELGEDGDMSFVAFTHDRRRALAALHRHLRTAPSSGPVRDITDQKPVWWLVHDNCGCGPQCPHEPWQGCDCENYGLPPCCRDGICWVWDECAPGTPGALPVITMGADLDEPCPTGTGTACARP